MYPVIAAVNSNNSNLLSGKYYSKEVGRYGESWWNWRSKEDVRQSIAAERYARLTFAHNISKKLDLTKYKSIKDKRCLARAKSFLKNASNGIPMLLRSVCTMSCYRGGPKGHAEY